MGLLKKMYATEYNDAGKIGGDRLWRLVLVILDF